MRRFALTVGVALAAVFSVCLAQDSRGSVTGILTDPQSAVMPGVNIAVTSDATNTVKRTVTNQTGYFEVSFLDPGKYTLTAEATGFKKLVRSGLTVDTGDRLALELRMEIGQSTQSVEVTCPRVYYFAFTLGLSSAFKSPSAYCAPARTCSNIGLMA